MRRMVMVIAVLAVLLLAGCSIKERNPKIHWTDCPKGTYLFNACEIEPSWECSEYKTTTVVLADEICRDPCLEKVVMEQFELRSRLPPQEELDLVNDCIRSCYPGIDWANFLNLTYEKNECVEEQLVRRLQ